MNNARNLLLTLRSFLGRRSAYIALVMIASWFPTRNASASLVGSYVADTNTLHLWHLDEAATPCVDSVSSGAMNLLDLAGGATLGNPSFSSVFTNSLNTAPGGAAKGDLLAASATSGNVTITLANASNGAFTFEAVVLIGFDPTVNSTAASEILSGESGATANRIFQWRIAPKGFTLAAGIVATNSPFMTFENIRAGSGSQATIFAPIPTSGPDAIISNTWYHVAVTYSGVPNTPGNIQMYWTLLDPSRIQADTLTITSAITQLTGLNPLSTVTTPFMIGNQARSKNGNFLGSIDEVRISSIARDPVSMMFTSSVLHWAIQPTNQFVAAGDTVSLVSLAGGDAPAYHWQFNSTNIPGATNATLVLTNISPSQQGSYTVIVSNNTSSLNSSAVITVGSLINEVFNTGVSANRGLLAGGAIDPHWQLTLSGDPAFPGPNAVTIGSPPASYLPNGPSSEWLAPVASGSAAGSADFGYTTTILIDTTDPATAILTGSWGTDNNGLDILLNGVSTGITVNGFAALSSFVITNGQVHQGLDTNGNPISITNLFVPGLNTLECITSNAPSGGDNPTALRVQLRGVALPLAPTAPQVLSSPQNVTTNALQNAAFSVVATGSAPLTYQWYLGTNQLSGQTTRNLLLSNLDPTNSGIYTVVVSNPVGTNSASATLTVTTPPLVEWLGNDPSNPSFWDTVTTNWVDTSSLADVAFSPGDNVIFDSAGAATPTVNLVQPLAPNAVFFNSTATYTLTSPGGGYLTGPALLIATNTGTVILDTPNNNTGQTIIRSGTVQVGNSDANGSLGSGPVIDNGTLVFDRVDTTTVPNPISGVGGVTMAGSGVVALSGANSYTGPTQIMAGGTLEALNGSALGSSTVTVVDGGELLIANDISVGNVPLILGGTGPTGNGALFHQGGGSGNIFGGAITLTDYTGIVLDSAATMNFTNAAGITGADVNLAVQGNSATSLGVVTGPVSIGAGSFTEYGTGTWELVSSNNNWTGGTTINTGATLQIGDGGNDGSLGNGPVSDNGTLAFNSSMTNFPIVPPISDQGKVTFAGSANFTWVGQLSGGGPVTDNSTGTMTLPSPNSGYSGAFSIGGTGLLVPQDSGAFGSGSIMVGTGQSDTCALLLKGNLNLPNNLAIFPRAFGTGNNPAQFINVSDTNVLSSANPIVIASGGNLLSFESDSGMLSIASGITAAVAGRDLVFKGAGRGEVLGNISSSGGNSTLVWKLDSGTWTLWGNNTPGQPTTISNGTFVINGTMDTNLITVAGGLLTGIGAIAGPVTVNSGAAIAPGPGLATLTVSGNLSLLAGSTTTMLLNKAAGTNSQIAGASSISYGGTLVVSNLGGTLVQGDVFQLFPAGGYTGTFSSFNLPPLSAGLVWGTGTLAIDGTLRVSTVTQPSFTTTVLSGTNLVMSGSGGGAGVTYSVLTSTNAGAHVSTWTVSRTGGFDASGHFNITNAISPGTPKRFFLLRTP
jgi:autotransporter-associated beta strand protein